MCFCDNSVKINCQNLDKTWWFRQHSWWIKHFPEIIRYFLVFMYHIRFIKLSPKLVFLDYKFLFLSTQKKREFRTQASVSSGQMHIFWEGLYQLNRDWYWIPKQCWILETSTYKSNQLVIPEIFEWFGSYLSLATVVFGVVFQMSGTHAALIWWQLKKINSISKRYCWAKLSLSIYLNWHTLFCLISILI